MNNCIVLYDDMVSQDPVFRQRIIDITDFYIGTPQGFDIFRTSTLTETLQGLADRGYRWAIVNALGHAVDQQAVLHEVIEQCTNGNHVLMAHLIAGQAGYPKIDSQFFALDLIEWTQLGSPAFELVPGPAVFRSMQFTRSEENFHDDYTPYWLDSIDAIATYKQHERPFGSRVVQALLEAGHKLVNFDNTIRSRKWHLYPNYNEESLLQFFNSGTVEDINVQPQIIKRIIQERDTLSQTIYVLNSEDVSKYTPALPAPIEHYIGVAGGFKGVLLLKKHLFNNNTRVTYVDVSDAALNYQKYLIDNWDGDLNLYSRTVQEYEQQFPSHRCIWRSWNIWDEEIDLFLGQAELSREQFRAVWQQYQQLNHTFLKLDLLKETDRFVKYVESVDAGCSYMWLSNAFDMQHTRFLLGKEYTEERFNYLKTHIASLGRRCIIESCGYFYKAN